jgi:ABC-type uncharacterized transport system substrate-binding protein
MKNGYSTVSPVIFFFVCSLLAAAVPLLSGLNGSVPCAAAAEPPVSHQLKLKPTTNEGKKWRIGYLEGGYYVDYPFQLLALIRGLMDMGWIQPADLPLVDGKEATGKIWQWLATECQSDYLAFVPDGFWSNNWHKEKRKNNLQTILRRLNQVKDIDMMLAMGTWAGQDLATDLQHTNTMVMSTSNPVLSNIINSPEDSGRSYIHAKIDPFRYIRQIELFHEIIGFKKLGLVYENSVEGRTYCALADVEAVAGKRGFAIIKCEAPYSGVSEQVAAEKVIQCHEQLAPQIDALYITTHQGIDKKFMDKLMAPLLQYKIPTWSQRGAEEVEYGALMSFARADFSDVGMFQAQVMAQILNNIAPGDIRQIYHDPRETIAFNLRTAQIIEFNPGLDILAAADQIYEEIKKYVKKPVKMTIPKPFVSTKKIKKTKKSKNIPAQKNR